MPYSKMKIDKDMENEMDITILFRICVLGISLSHTDQAFLLGNVLGTVRNCSMFTLHCPLVSLIMTIAQEGSPSKERSL